MRNVSPYKPDSQQAARFDIPPIRRFVIPLVGDRSAGVYIPQIEGQYAYIESCDLPCEIGFVNADRDQTIAVPDGSAMHGAFKGVVIKHDNYVSQTEAKLVIVVSKDAMYENSLAMPTVRWPVAFNRQVTLGVAGQVSYRFPVQNKSRRIDSLSFCLDVTMAAALAGRVLGKVYFAQTVGGAPAIPSPPVTIKNGVNYAERPGYATVRVVNVATIDAAAFKYTIHGVIEDVPIPSMIEYGILLLQFPAAPNLVSVDSVAADEFSAYVV